LTSTSLGLRPIWCNAAERRYVPGRAIPSVGRPRGFARANFSLYTSLLPNVGPSDERVAGNSRCAECSGKKRCDRRAIPCVLIANDYDC
jgi:hypothetical protein